MLDKQREMRETPKPYTLSGTSASHTYILMSEPNMSGWNSLGDAASFVVAYLDENFFHFSFGGYRDIRMPREMALLCWRVPWRYRTFPSAAISCQICHLSWKSWMLKDCRKIRETTKLLLNVTYTRTRKGTSRLAAIRSPTLKPTYTQSHNYTHTHTQEHKWIKHSIKF